MSESEDLTPLPGYYVTSLRVRRELVPVYEDDKLVAYRCLTYSVNGPAEGDKVMADQVEFEDELIRLKLMEPRGLMQSPVRWTYAKVWRGLGVDKWKLRTPPSDEPTETLLRFIN